MILRFILGSLIAMAAVAGAVVSSGTGARGLIIVECQGLILMILAPLGAMLAGYGPRGLLKSFRAALSGEPGLETEGELRSAKAFFRSLSRAIVISGILGFFLGFLWTLADLSVKADLPVSFARSIVPLYLGYFLILWLILPFQAAIDRKLAVGYPEENADTVGTEAEGMKRRFPPLLGILLALAAVAGCNYAWFRNFFPSFFLLFDTPSILLVPVLFFATALITMSPAGLARCFSLAFGKKGEAAGASDFRSALAEAVFLSRSAAALSGFGFFSGNLFLLTDVYDKMNVGPCAAVSIISAIYGMIILLCVCIPLKAALERRLALAKA